MDREPWHYVPKGRCNGGVLVSAAVRTASCSGRDRVPQCNGPKKKIPGKQPVERKPIKRSEKLTRAAIHGSTDEPCYGSCAPRKRS